MDGRSRRRWDVSDSLRQIPGVQHERPVPYLIVLLCCYPFNSAARWRSTYFCTMPVEVLGNAQNTIVRGTLKRARLLRQKAMRSSAVALAPSFSVTKAQGVSPHVSSG